MDGRLLSLTVMIGACLVDSELKRVWSSFFGVMDCDVHDVCDRVHVEARR